MSCLPRVFSRFTNIVGGLRLAFSGCVPGRCAFSLAKVTRGLLRDLAAFLNSTIGKMVGKAPNFLFDDIMTLITNYCVSGSFSNLSGFVGSLYNRGMCNGFLHVGGVVARDVFGVLGKCLVLVLVAFLRM